MSTTYYHTRVSSGDWTHGPISDRRLLWRLRQLFIMQDQTILHEKVFSCVDFYSTVIIS